MTVEDIARVCHEVNREYCRALGDDSQPSWGEAPDWQRSSAMNGVEFHRDHPEADPENSHESWLKEKEAAGWSWGPAKDPEKKEHPCCVPFDRLPTEQKAKDFIFRGVVHALIPHLSRDEAFDPGPTGNPCCTPSPMKPLPQWVFVAGELAQNLVRARAGSINEGDAKKLVSAAKILTGGL